MIFNVFTLFPGFFESPIHSGLMGKACEAGIITVNTVDIRDYSDDRFHRCDDYPYGGGSGMVLKPEPLMKALDNRKGKKGTTLLTSPGGRVLDQNMVKEFSRIDEIDIICGHYEGVDQRVIDEYVDFEISIGDYILSGGEFASLIIIDSIVRYIPGFMSNQESLCDESFEDNLLEYPQYTRPETIRGIQVPEVLLSGHHENIKRWRREQSIEKTRKVRPDLYQRYLLNKITGE